MNLNWLDWSGFKKRDKCQKQTLKTIVGKTQMTALFIKTIEKGEETHIKTHIVRR